MPSCRIQEGSEIVLTDLKHRQPIVSVWAAGVAQTLLRNIDIDFNTGLI